MVEAKEVLEVKGDGRAYVARYRGPNYAPVMIAYDASAVKGNVTYDPVEEWTSERGETVRLVEVMFSKQKASDLMKQAIDSGGSTMSGPDLYHILDSKSANVLGHLWQPVFLPKTMELMLQKGTAKSPASAQKAILISCLIGDDQLADHIRKEWETFTNTKWKITTHSRHATFHI